MNAKLTQDELQAIKERAEKATEGPWELSCVGISAVGTPRNDVLWATINEDIYGNKADVEFVLNARQDVPKLLAEVDRLCKALEFYADKTNYNVYTDASNNCPTTNTLMDDGHIAREALK